MMLIRLLLAAVLAQIVAAALPSNSTVDCTAFTDCVSCTEGARGVSSCFWCEGALKKSCAAYATVTDFEKCTKAGSSVYRYEDTCSVNRPLTNNFLPNWMGKTMDVIKDLTLLDLSLPGTHDTLSYDLSLQVSDGGADDFLKLAEVLHNYTKIVPNGIEDYIRQQSQTQDLDITQQLDNGIRFLDARMMYEYADPNPDWYSLHFMQSSVPFINYMNEVRSWLDKHPDEIVVIWLSKHGSECAVGVDQYPNTPIEVKQAYWNKITEVFSGLLTDFTVTKINESTIADMIARNHRVVIYASDYVELTGSSKYALNGCDVDNKLGPSVSEEVDAKAWEENMFKNAYATKMADKAQQKFFLMSLATGVPGEQMAFAAKIRFLPYDQDDVMKCASAFSLPGMSWCPETLLDIAQLENYYKQITLEETIQSALSGNSLSTSMGFPNAIYINGVDVEGTIRTGTEVMWGKARDETTDHLTTAYAYADTMILYNVLVGCENRRDLAATCSSLKSMIQSRRAKNPTSYWSNEHLGRLVNWP